jgi:hypothetical protein
MRELLSTSPASTAASGARILEHRIQVTDIYSLEDVTAYFQQRRGKAYRGFPILSMGATALNQVALLLERLRQAHLASFRDLLIMAVEAGTYAITTHIETDTAGERACRFLREHAVSDAEVIFAAELQCLTWAVSAERRLWVAAGQPIFQIHKMGAAITHPFGDN